MRINLADGLPADRIAPIGGDGEERGPNKAALTPARVGDTQAAVMPQAAAPEDDVDVDRAIAPALAATTTETPLDRLGDSEQCRRSEHRFNQHCAIGKAALGWANRRAVQDRRRGEQADVGFTCQRRDGISKHRGGYVRRP